MVLYMPRFPGLLKSGLCRGTAEGDMTPPTITLDVIGLTRGTVAPEPKKLKGYKNKFDKKGQKLNNLNFTIWFKFGLIHSTVKILGNERISPPPHTHTHTSCKTG